MQLVTIGPKYQIVIPKEVRKKIKNLKPGGKVSVYTHDEGKSITIDPEPQSWVERTAGMMTDAWKGIDPIAEVEKMRGEWGDRLKEQEKIWNETKKS